MQTLGAIVTKRKLKDNVGFVEVVNSIDSVSNPSNPILIIGINEAKKVSTNFSILNKKIDNGVFWTFGKTEKRDEHEKDIKLFYDYVLNNVIEKIPYYYINLFKISINKIKTLINILNNNIIKYIYINNNIIYIYYNNYIMGISLDVTDYLGIKREKILSKIHKNKSNIIQYNDSFIDGNLRHLIKNKKYIVAYLMSLQEKKWRILLITIGMNFR